MTEKRVYPDGATLETKATFSRPESYNSGTILYESLGYVVVDQLNAGGTLLARTTHYQHGSARASLSMGATDYADYKQGREYQTENFDIINNSPVLRRSVAPTWSQPVNGGTWPLGQAETGNAKPNAAKTVDTLLMLKLLDQLPSCAILTTRS